MVPTPDDNATIFVEIAHAGETALQLKMPYVRSFGYVDQGKPLLYSDSLQTIGLAVNSGNFAEQYEVQAGADWRIRIRK